MRRHVPTNDLSSALALLSQLQGAQSAMTDMIPQLHEARTRWARTRSAEDRAHLDRVEADAQAKRDIFDDLLLRTQAASGIPDEVFDKLSEPEIDGDSINRVNRSLLTVEHIEPDNSIEEVLPDALEALIRRLPNGWLDEEEADRFRLPVLDDGRPVSIVKGIRPESEAPQGHRLRQMVRASLDFLAGDPRYDHFGGAMLVPQAATLGRRLASLGTVTNAAERIANLWRKPSEVDNTVYELLVAGALAEKGREPSFIPEMQEKTPDIRCMNPFPQVVECKRRQALSEYEQREEQIMRALFSRLDAKVRALGMFGVFELSLTVEAELVDVDAVADKAALQRFAPRPDHPVIYPWGSIAFRDIPRRIALPQPTKAYSPDMLEYAFDWESDVPDWDGLVCKVRSAEGVSVDEVRDGVALAWRNDAAAAIVKRAKPPTSLFGKAANQIPGGEFGIVYLAYMEGAREEVANRRVEQVLDRLQDWEHSAMFRIPHVIVNRLYPRPLGWGGPDLIESSIPLLSEISGGEPWYREAFPSRIFVPGKM